MCVCVCVCIRGDTRQVSIFRGWTQTVLFFEFEEQLSEEGMAASSGRVHIYTYIYMYTYTYMYVYIYICI